MLHASASMSDNAHMPTICPDASQFYTDAGPMNYKKVLCEVLENQPTGLTLNGIYAHITELYPHLRHGGPHNWRCRIRNTLTVSQNFTRLPDKHGRRGGKWILTNISPLTPIKRHSCPVGGQMSLVAALAAQQQQPLQHHNLNGDLFAPRPRAVSLEVAGSPQSTGHGMMMHNTTASDSMPEYYGSTFGMEFEALTMISADSSPVASMTAAAHTEAAMYHHHHQPPQSASAMTDNLESMALLHLLTEMPWNNNNNGNADVHSTQPIAYATPHVAARQHTLEMFKLDNATPTVAHTVQKQEMTCMTHTNNYLSPDNRMITTPPPATHHYNFLDNHVGIEQPPVAARQFHSPARVTPNVRHMPASAPVNVPRMPNASYRTMSSASMHAFMNNVSSDLSHQLLVAPAQGDVSTSLPRMFRTSPSSGNSPSFLAGKMLSAASIEHITSLASELMNVKY